MVSEAKNLPIKWDLSTSKNIKWVADLGSQTFSSPVVNGAKVFIGTNNDGKRNPKIKGDKGVIICLAENDGKFLWQAVHDKLPSAEKHDWPQVGICSSPCVVGDRLYYVSNRCELVCLDTEGFYDNENDGPITDEKYKDPTDADFIWLLDMAKELGVVPLFASASSPMIVDDLVFVVTGNGFDQDQEKVPAPRAPSFIAVNRATGKVIWRDNSPGDRILDGQWSSPAYGVVNGKPQALFPGGDGWLYAFEPKTGSLIWQFNCRAGEDETRNTLVATPVCHDNKVFVAVGQNPENGDGPGCLWAIDETNTGDVTSTAELWHYGGENFGRSVSTVAIGDGLLYAAESSGYLHCLNVATGQRLWRHDLEATVWGSALLADGKVYIANQDGDVTVLKHGPKLQLIAENSMNDAVYGSPVAAGDVLYIATRAHLYAIANPQGSASRPSTSAPAQSETGLDWPMFRGNPQLTGVAADLLPVDLELCWRFEAPEAIESSAAIAGDSIYFGCDDGYCYALDLVTGSARWRYKADEAIRSSPCIYDHTVFFGDDGGTFHAVDARGGKNKWTFRTEGEIISSPNHVDGEILFGSYDGCLYCLAAGTGKLIWKFETEGRVHGTPGVAGDNVLIAGCDERLRVIRLQDGVNTGAVNMGSFSGASAAIGGPRVYVGTFGNQVIAVDWTKNRIAWTYEHPDRDFPFYGSAAVTDELVVIGGRDKIVHALDAKTGKACWTFATNGRIDASPVIVGKRVFIGSTDGYLYALNLVDGKLIWQFEVGSAIIASPAVAHGRLVVGAEDGVLYCFGRKRIADD